MLLLDTLERKDFALLPVKIATNDNYDDRNHTLTIILMENPQDLYP